MCLNPLTVKHPRLRSERYLDSLDGVWRPDTSLAEVEFFNRVHKYQQAYLVVPCGRCVDCRKARGNEWRTRLNLENQYGNHKNAIFVTLTISPDYYVEFQDRQNQYSFIRKFCDRWRKRFGKAPKRFFVTELGDDTGRLHFHGIIWDVPFYTGRYKLDNPVLQDLWKYGHTWMGYVDSSTCNYITKYITKPSEFDPKFIPAVFASPKLGLSYLDSEVRDVIRRDGGLRRPLIHVAKSKVVCPRYIYNKCFTEDERFDKALYDAWCVVPYGYWDPPSYKGHRFPDRDSYQCYIKETYLDSLRRRTSLPPKGIAGRNSDLTPNLDFVV